MAGRELEDPGYAIDRFAMACRDSCGAPTAPSAHDETIAGTMISMATDLKTIKRSTHPGLERDGRFGMTIKPMGEARRGQTVRFGGVTVVAPRPEAQAIKKQIAEGKRAVSGLKKVLTKPGLRIREAADTPVFRADPRDASLVIRRLNGQETRGRFVDGQFVSQNPE